VAFWDQRRLIPPAGGQLDAVLDVPLGIPVPAVMTVPVEPAGDVPAPASDPFLAGPVVRGS